MITRNNLAKLLTTMGFDQQKDCWTKVINRDVYNLFTIDFSRQQISYPSSVKINDLTTCNFEHPENFVVFECVHRLMEKGYRPEHIELERRWTLGHEQKSGKADIIVSDDKGNTLIIIECKTAGVEYKNARSKLFEDGGQLFSYWQQERGTQWLSLYASDFDEQKNTLSYKDTIVNCSDDRNTLLTAKTDNNIKLFTNAHTAQELFAAWKETYNQQSHEGLIFGADSIAYKIGVKPLRKGDLRDFTSEDKIVNRFEEILRHNNVSDKENAFNRLVALFICKLVDEITKQENDEVEFQYKQGSDDYETLQDRLQRLHRDGMQQFMRENISYVEYDYAEKLFEQYNGRQRKNAIADLKNTIRILKFYSNNDFAFKDVHNEELFLQNGKVLVEMVQLFQPFRIVYASRNQLLGDLFEQLLNKGFKQNEGQFFTPMPITRFMWDCLPLAELTQRIGNSYPRIVDFACGAGHFLTEAVEAINHFIITADKENRWAEESIYGIEKDYRLARVARVSLYMNGAGRGNIIFGDGLDNHPDKGVCPASFDILVANPPYAVKGFKGFLRLKDNQLDSLDVISNDSGDIQVPFVERIAQLLKPRGLAAVVLPSSLLSNGDKGATCARNILLRNFLLRGIAQFGSKTFGATGTNTVVLFLEKYNEPPRHCEMIADSVNAILSGKPQADWDEQTILTDYLQRIGVDSEDYNTFTAESRMIGEWDSVDYFKQYAEAFRKDKSFKDIIKRKDFQKQNSNEQQNRLKRAFYAFAKSIERAKLEAFALTRAQTTVVATAPAGNNEQERYLGYSWSNAKGSEGIRIRTPYAGALYDDANRESDDTVAAALRHSFTSPNATIPTTAESFCKTVATADMIDFSRASFSNTITPNVVKKVEIKSKWKMMNLLECLKGNSVVRGVTYDKTQQVVGRTNNVILTADNITLDGHFEVTKEVFLSDEVNLPDEKRLVTDDCFMCFSSGSKQHVGKVCLMGQDTHYYAGGFMAILRSDKSKIYPAYLYNLMNSSIMREVIRQKSTGTNIQNLNNSIGEVQIPLPPLDVQQEIVAVCSAIDAEYANAKQTIENKKQEIERFVSGVTTTNIVQLKDACTAINPSRAELNNISNDTLVSFIDMPAMGLGQIEKVNDRPLRELLQGSYTFFRDEDILIAKITPCMENGKCAIAEHLTNGIGMGSTEFHVFRANNKIIITKYLFCWLNRTTIRENAAKVMTGSSGHRRVPISFYENLSIPLPTLEDQRKVVAHVEELEADIAQARQLMASCADRKQAVLHKYL